MGRPASLEVEEEMAAVDYVAKGEQQLKVEEEMAAVDYVAKGEQQLTVPERNHNPLALPSRQAPQRQCAARAVMTACVAGPRGQRKTPVCS